MAQRALPPTKAEISVNTSGGFARIVFRFVEEVESTVQLANGILVIGFKTPVDFSVDRLAFNLPGYVGAARRDPDGKGLRVALNRKLTLHTIPVGERLFVDLLPDTWSGPPPGPPEEVVEELARRARDADRKSRAQRMLAKQQSMTLTRVRVGHQPTFSRYVFDLPSLMSVDSSRDKDALTLVFEAPLKFDLADAKATLPPMIEAIESKTGEDSTSVRFELIGAVDLRSFREDNSYVVDVSITDAPPLRRSGVKPAGEGAAPVAAVLRDAPLAGLEAPKTVPLRTAAPKAEAPKAEAPKAEAPRAEAPKSVMSELVVSEPSVLRPASAVSPPLGIPAAALAAPKSSNVNRAVAAAPDAMAVAPTLAPQVAAPAVVETAVPASRDKDAPSGPRLASADTSQVEAQRKPPGQVSAELVRQSETIKIVFPFATPTPAAIFRRADEVWIVFDAAAKMDVATLEADPSHTIRGVAVSASGEGQVIRLRLDRPRLISASADGASWTVSIGDSVTEPTRPLAVSRNYLGSSRASAAIVIEDARTVHNIPDPEAGDSLWVVTALAPARGFLKEQSLVEFRVLASTHGVALQPLADDLKVDLDADKVVVSRAPGLLLSNAVGAGRRDGAGRSVIFDPQLWGYDREATFPERLDKLTNAAASAIASKRTGPRLELARFYFAREMYAEAKGVLDVAMSEERVTAEDPTPLMMRAIASVLMRHVDDGLRDLANPIVSALSDVPLWRGLALTEQGKWQDARENYRKGEGALAALPVELQRTLVTGSIRAAIEVRDFASAAEQLSDLNGIGISKPMESDVAVLSGRVAEGLGHDEEALTSYHLAALSDDGIAAARARLLEASLRFQRGDIKRSEVVSELELITTVWRGDVTEAIALQTLAKLYTEDQRYRDAFHLMRTALKAHPNSDTTRRIQDEAAASFDSLFLAGKGDSMPPVEALALFYDFRELTPIGRRGDEMIRRLADRLAAIDLLDQATALLQHQVDHRLQGAARAQVATRLAVIYLMNRKPEKALATLRSTRSSDLSTDLRNQRLLIEGRALSDVGRQDVALEVIANIEGREAMRLRADILWSAKRWREAAEQIEVLYADRWKDWQPLAEGERADLLRAAIGYSVAQDVLGLTRFRDKYVAKMMDTPDRRTFEIATTPLTATSSDFREVARAIAQTDTLDSFLRDLRERYPGTGSFTPDRGKEASRKKVDDPTSTGSILPPRKPISGTPSRLSPI